MRKGNLRKTHYLERKEAFELYRRNVEQLNKKDIESEEEKELESEEEKELESEDENELESEDEKEIEVEKDKIADEENYISEEGGDKNLTPEEQERLDNEICLNICWCSHHKCREDDKKILLWV